MKTILTAIAIALLLPLTNIAPEFWKSFLCYPSAQFSGLFLNAPIMATGEGYMILVPPFPIHVTLSCSAAGFFVLSTILAAVVFTDRQKGLRIGSLLAAGAYGYGVTLAANCARIILAWYAERCARLVLAEPFWGSVHLCVGLGVFVTFLVLAYGILTWRPRHEQLAQTI
ncbi:MAG: hypothetical protein O2923_01265 [Verrucomicrobia bacterium]|nr:hypothetical protein [Verrucomicrobiota bacterium]MDA1085423.1 hypothetical protein [Verrucomicrobiota bacterium]